MLFVSGTYTCVASTATNLVTDSGLLTVVGIPPAFAQPHEPVPPLLEGEDVTLHCQLTAGYPPPLIAWFKDGVPIDEDLVEVNGDTLVIRESQAAQHSGDYACRAANAWGRASVQLGVKVRRRTQIVSPAVSVEYVAGSSVVLDCTVDVDANLMGSLEVEWWKGEHRLDDLVPALEDFHVGETAPRDEAASAESLVSRSLVQLAEGEEEEEEGPRLMLLPNASLRISRLQQEDLGYYSCRVKTELEADGLRSEVSQIYIASSFPFWILILVLCILLILLLAICLAVRLRRRTRGKGYYGVTDIEKTGGKHNKSDIYYTTEDGDSVMNEQDNLPLNTSTPSQPRTPIFTPKTRRHLANVDKAAGSVGSLLEDDEFLRRGMDEDGSFRERYAD
jgi:hypothetical protein